MQVAKEVCSAIAGKISSGLAVWAIGAVCRSQCIECSCRKIGKRRAAWNLGLGSQLFSDIECIITDNTQYQAT